MIPVIDIFPATVPEQYATARELFVEYAAQLGHNLCFQGFARELETLPAAYAPPRGCLLLARAGDGWAGCVALRPFDESTCEMKRLYVRGPYRRGGLGRRMAVAVIACARESGYRRMRLDTLASMHVARTLYESLGFREIEPYYHNPIERVIFYELDLRSPASPAK